MILYHQCGCFILLKAFIYFRYFDQSFCSDRKQTLGVDCYEKEHRHLNKTYLVKIWDTAGQEKYAVMAKSYYQRAHGIIVCCALDNRNSFMNLRNWLNSINENSKQENIKIILIGNKADLVESRQVKEWELSEKADEKKLKHFETSAKDGQNIQEAFDYIIKECLSSITQTSYGFNLSSSKGTGKLTDRICKC